MRPVAVLLFIVFVLAVLALIGRIFPSDGIRIGAVTLEFPDALARMASPADKKVDISAIIALKVDSAGLSDTLGIAAVDATRTIPGARIIYPANDPGMLRPALAALNAAATSPHAVHVLHYGDSQLEGDRITSYLRNKFQLRWGGGGMGLLPIIDVGPSFSVDREPTENWERFSVMEHHDPPLGHQRYGALWSFCRFTPVVADSLINDSVLQEGRIVLRKVGRAYGRSQRYTRCRVFFAHNHRPVTLSVGADDAVPENREFSAGDMLRIAEFNVNAHASLDVTFTGSDSPEVYGISLESTSGVVVDNLAARGAGGTELRNVEKTLLKAMYTALDVELLILQFGGNAVPHIESAQDAEEYGAWLGSQIVTWRTLCGGVPVILIGPSDMSIKDGTGWTTRPWLEEVNAALKKHALANGAAYFDLFAAMGGRNSMVSWVEADPPLAAPDYTHFSPQGASRMAELFCEALFNDLDGLNEHVASHAD
ncbi:MAG: hypothetical protein JST41_13650 [Bacteroidetes bacterium]|jgi:lysophospholipase L1-like esterase|nr:hypothetical protein [Bacteroidota bacterium]HMU12772.1 GDSL-type esterase/lipase family protein [Flavobacteriales bacterium]HMZ47564.1 GDSL-type esterase/lipase family protein [Flavobacteriales bacterium]HNK39588.1 GDSL-type esterase/lipase family protein [Flavobacteriales bacterium]HNK67280.1 GDSL-type esterase/lipase family protein [Flavobacteriales bacterium]